MNEQKQPDWLKVAVVTTIIGGVVQVFVNHFDNLLTFVGGAIAHTHLPVSLSIILNILSALATIGGAIATVLVYYYRLDAKKLRSAIKQIDKLVTEVLDRQKERARTLTEPINWDEIARRFAQETLAYPAQTPEQSGELKSAPPTINPLI